MPQLNTKPGAEPKSFPIITIHSPGGLGKTRAAGTASAKYAIQSPVEKLVHLDDLLWLQFDVDGIRSLQSLGMEPDYLDFSDQPVDAPVWLAGVLETLKKWAPEVKKKGYYAIVTDTLTTVTRYLETYHLSIEIRILDAMQNQVSVLPRAPR